MPVTPVLFPYTTVSRQQSRSLARFFPTLTLIRPLEDIAPTGAEDPFIRVHAPYGDHCRKLRRLIGAYRRWAQQHPGTDLAAWSGRGQAVPFFDETSVNRIRTQIRRGEDTRAPDDPLFDCRLFLGMTEEFDRQSAEATQRLVALEEAQARMIEKLRGHAVASLHQQRSQDAFPDALIYRLARRIRAWAGLYLGAPLPGAIFVTPLPEVVDQVRDVCGADRLRPVGDIAPPEPGGTLMGRLASLADEPAPPWDDTPKTAKAHGPNHLGPRLKIYLAADQPPEVFWAAFSPPGIKSPPVAASLRHTLVAVPMQ